MNKKYELVFIIQPERTESEALSEVEKLRTTLEKTGAKITFEDFWGKRDLAYSVQKYNQGYYQLFEFEADPKKLSEIDNELNLDKNVIRHLITIVPDAYQTKSFKDFVQDEPVVAKKPGKRQQVAKATHAKRPSKPENIDEDDDDNDVNEKLDKMLANDFDV